MLTAASPSPSFLAQRDLQKVSLAPPQQTTDNIGDSYGTPITDDIDTKESDGGGGLDNTNTHSDLPVVR